MKIITILCVAVGLILGLSATFMVILFGIADILPDAVEAIDKTRVWLKRRKDEGEDDKG